MYNLSFPPPVARLLRRLFNVFTSVTISNRYFLLRCTEHESTQDRACNNSSTGASSKLLQALSTQASRVAFFIRKQDGTLGIFRRLKFRELANENVSQDVPLRWGRPRTWDMLSLSLNTVVPSTTGCARFQYVPLGDDSNEKSTPLLPAPPPEPPRTLQHPNLDRRSSLSSAPKLTLNNAEVRSSDSIVTINTLMFNPALFAPVRKPRNPIVLCHGLYGYDVWGPSSFPKLQFHYWANVLKILKEKIGAEVIVTGVPSTGSIEERANKLDKFLSEKAKGQGINFVAHSMGGLDCRYLITHVKPKAYCPSSLFTICTPHRGSPFMDWCKSNLGLGRLRQQAERETVRSVSNPNASPISTFSLANLPSSFTTLLLSILDSPAYACLTTHYLERVFNPTTPDDPHVRYYSVAARIANMSIWHPLFLPKIVLDGAEERMRVTESETSGKVSPNNDWGNDGLVTVRSARWGEFLGTLEGVDHWGVRGVRGLGGNDNSNVEWSIDLSAVRNSLSDPFAHVGTNWPDWGRLASWWRAEHRENGHNEPERLEEKRASSTLAAEELREQEAVLRSSTEKFSAVFDWIAEQVPYARSNPSSSSNAPTSLSLSPSSSPSRLSSTLQEKQKSHSHSDGSKDKNDLSRTFDLERFYTALSRKLYDDGL